MPQPGTSLELSNSAPGLSSSSDIDQMVPVLVDASHLLPGGDRKSLPLSCQVRSAGRIVPCGLLGPAPTVAKGLLSSWLISCLRATEALLTGNIAAAPALGSAGRPAPPRGGDQQSTKPCYSCLGFAECLTHLLVHLGLNLVQDEPDSGLVQHVAGLADRVAACLSVHSSRHQGVARDVMPVHTKGPASAPVQTSFTCQAGLWKALPNAVSQSTYHGLQVSGCGRNLTLGPPSCPLCRPAAGAQLSWEKSS